MTPLARYQQLIASGEYQPDPEQAQVMHEFDKVYMALKPRFVAPGILKKSIQWLKPKSVLVKGLYIWGDVGVGKTWMMDIFYHCMPEAVRMRMHFHRFMREVHRELKRLQGSADPLNLIAKRIAKTKIVICFDEFFVHDITDAMLLAGLLEALFNEGVTLVTTSNTAPDELYKNGLQRERFLPAIAHIKQNTTVLHMVGNNDYRLRELHQAGVYFYPIDDTTRDKMRARFEAIVTKWEEHELLLIAGRGIPTVRSASGVVWINFQVLCSTPRSQMDYLELAQSFHTIFLSQVPKFGSRDNNQVLYLINLVDICYDTKVNLVISAAVPIEDLYQEGRLKQEFERTKSRLYEMQSIEYLQTPHLVARD